jgi:hypothetical protein
MRRALQRHGAVGLALSRRSRYAARACHGVLGIHAVGVAGAGAGSERVLAVRRCREGCCRAHRSAVGEGRGGAGPPTVHGGWAAVLCHGVPDLRGAVPRRHFPQVALSCRLRCRCVTLRRRVPVEVLSAAIPSLARILRPETIRDGWHKVALVRVGLVVVVKDIGVAGPPRGLVAVAAASVHGAETVPEPYGSTFPLTAS